MGYETHFWGTFTVTPPKRPASPCRWEPTPDGSALRWNEVTKFYDYDEWLRHLIAHYLAPWGYLIEGKVRYSGESDRDEGVIRVVNNLVTREDTVTYW